MRFLGISAFYHDSAAALVEDGRIVAAGQEERFSRKKFDDGFPTLAVQYCLAAAGVRLRDVDYVLFYDKPFLKIERLVETYLAYAPRGWASYVKAMPVWLGEKLFQKSMLTRELQRIDSAFDPEKLLFTEHHHSHAASAFYPSPFEEAVILTMDGVGEWCTTTASLGKRNKIDIVKEIHFPHSLGLLYSAFTYYTGFRVNSGEYKLMGLAPYGEPRFCKLIREEAVLAMTRGLAAEFGQKNLCLAGGVALNCVANGKIVRDGHFDRLWIQPAAGDAGGALGAALVGHYLFCGSSRSVNGSTWNDTMAGAYLGPSYSDSEIQLRLAAEGAQFEMIESDDVLFDLTARALADGQAVGWFQGRMEFGPRALGNRSILADPRSREMQKTLNLKIGRAS